MLRSPLVRLVDWCARHAWPVIAVALALSCLSVVYAARHFAIQTDINDLFPPTLPWTQRALAFTQAFPQHDILVVVDAPTSEFADAAAAKLTAALAADKEHVKSAIAPRGGAFFAQNGLLYMPADELAKLSQGMQHAAPVIGALAADPTLRGALSALNFGVIGVANGAFPREALIDPMKIASDMIEDAVAGRPVHFSWRALAGGKPAAPGELRRFIEVAPVVDYQALEPGRAATDAIKATAQRLNLETDYQARVRLTGIRAIDDDQFATMADHAVLHPLAAIGAVVVILWLALRSWRIIAAVLLSLLCGLVMTAALGLFLVGALNLISIAFFVLFIGLGVDFGIQFSVRYRAERHDTDDLRPALVSAARKAGGPLALASVATALGFAAFVPTNYRGLGELGAIAGPGMLIAFLTSVTLLPALLAVFKPPSEPRPMGLAWLAPVDRFLQRRRIPVVVVTLIVVIVALPLLRHLPFDFDPIHMSDTRKVSVATFLDLRSDPQTGANAIEIVSPNQGDADATAQRLRALPQVARAVTLANLIPSDQDTKLALIRQMATALRPSLNPTQTKPPPSDAQTLEALLTTGISLNQYASISPGRGAEAANRLFGLLLQLARPDPALRQRVAAALSEPLRISLAGLRGALNAQAVNAGNLPAELKREWLAPNGRARVQVLPKGDPNDTAVLRDFVKAVTAAAPQATGPAVALYEAANTTVRAFVEAGIFALSAIFVLLWITLRRLTDVLLTLLPLLLAAVVTLELCVVLDLPLNFANVIALPLLLGVGVAFKIYYIMAWRRGRTALVQSTLSRAVIFSAMTTGAAFGSLWLSSHPGTSSMGKLMGLALMCTMAAAVLFQPALMGSPRQMTPQRELPEPAAAATADKTPDKAREPVEWVVAHGGRQVIGEADGAPAADEERTEDAAVAEETRR